MVYSQKFVMCVLVNGVPQKELANGEVHIPFGTEYEVRFRNKNNRRAKVKFEIDGEDVSGGGYVIEPNSFIDIKRHNSHDARFKFVDLDSGEAVDAGKNGPNHDKVKGTIVAHFWLEQERPKEVHHHHHHDHYRYIPQPYPVYPSWPKPWSSPSWLGDNHEGYNVTCDTNPTSGLGGGTLSMNSQPTMSFNASSDQSKGISGQGMARVTRSRAKSFDSKEAVTLNSFAPTLAQPEVKDGCTVEGAASGQTFGTVYGIIWETTCTTLKCFLRGTATVVAQAAVTSKDRRLNEVEAENEQLRRQLAELENAQLKAKLETVKKPQPKRVRKKK